MTYWEPTPDEDDDISDEECTERYLLYMGTRDGEYAVHGTWTGETPADEDDDISDEECTCNEGHEQHYCPYQAEIHDDHTSNYCNASATPCVIPFRMLQSLYLKREQRA
jgi:hypothetical protein